MRVEELVTALHKFPVDTDVEIYVGKCCDVQPIHLVHFQPADADSPALVVLVNESQQIRIPGRCLQLNEDSRAYCQTVAVLVVNPRPTRTEAFVYVNHRTVNACRLRRTAPFHS
jgi:hypothetical protein